MLKQQAFPVFTRQELIDHCLELPQVYEDYPFHDDNWTLMRYREGGHAFALIFERQGKLWINVKCAPEWHRFWREQYACIVPAYHMNKEHWLSVILDGTLPPEDLFRLIRESYGLVCPQKQKKEKKNK